MEVMISEYKRIESSIDKIDSFHQVASTIKWIRLFEKMFKAPAQASSLLTQLQTIEL